ncbi:phosphate signaling complex protein PhoU [Clostridium tertium]|jgi:phosphate transport system protein|uniref:Phosphate-specific transport system accessory protein PhoU n=2 Tax=Clostridium TaxID=1485 RepID=A0A9X3XIU7_9CLOT|nr:MULTISPECIES: phosphate signaling complex protein PhoU [Clostridium]EEH98207.1 phosphate transport system regulatory protein PhoU [Clostridium sp. 7_2_43FAA]MBP1866943.1 phosphate transport system protein [Clostridium tertium]MBS5883393.1 phosphate signaling complex protein PhoU [Clostridium sp.]MBS6503402.1 phosphate signaling complex protein PhoU [Clostridium sp.]MDB1939978.1 phosphate signaling complex protein PhoU [Clostridium tertium]
MMREVMSNKIKLLNSELIEMASLVEKQIYDSMTALKDQDLDLAKKVMKNDDKVDDLQKEIEEKCVKFMATESPVARDLRSIYTTSKIVTDLERMADYAVDICKIVPRVKGVNFSNEIAPIWQIVDIIISMIKLAIEAYVKGDEKAAYEICDMDDRVDEIYQGMFEIVLKKMGKDESMINQGTQILFASKYLERIGDHVTNICEWIIFSKKGNYVDLNE